MAHLGLGCAGVLSYEDSCKGLDYPGLGLIRIDLKGGVVPQAEPRVTLSATGLSQQVHILNNVLSAGDHSLKASCIATAFWRDRQVVCHASGTGRTNPCLRYGGNKRGAAIPQLSATWQTGSGPPTPRHLLVPRCAGCGGGAARRTGSHVLSPLRNTTTRCQDIKVS